MTTAVVLLAAGSGSRVGAELNKVLLPLDGEALLVRSLTTVLALPDLARVLVVVRPGEEDTVAAVVLPHLRDREVLLIAGGRTRHDSEWAALQALEADIAGGQVDVVAIHDAARPLAGADLFHAVVAAAREHGGALPVVPVRGVLGPDGPVTGVVAVQTPQAFRAADLLAAYTRAEADGFTGTDTAGCLERHGDVRVAAVPSSPRNLKVTYPEDLDLVARLATTD